MALVNGAFTLRCTVYWKREEQCSTLREPEEKAFWRVSWESTLHNFIGRYILLNFTLSMFI